MLLNEAKRGMKSEKSRLAIFDTFKTKTQQITGEASRQRAIIHHLSNSTNSASKTRTAISGWLKWILTSMFDYRPSNKNNFIKTKK